MAHAKTNKSTSSERTVDQFLCHQSETASDTERKVCERQKLIGETQAEGRVQNDSTNAPILDVFTKHSNM